MDILVLENNLMWSAKLKQTLTHLGHAPTIATQAPDQAFNVAIVNLSVEQLRGQIPSLVSRGIKVVGHAGHKEKDLHAIGKELGCSKVATNSELTFKLEEVLGELEPCLTRQK